MTLPIIVIILYFKCIKMNFISSYKLRFDEVFDIFM